MSISYEPKPIGCFKYQNLKDDIANSRIPGLNYEESNKKTTMPKGTDSFVVNDIKGNGATVYKVDNGNVLITFYSVTDNIPWFILHKLARHYNCDIVDEEGAEGNASDYLALWREENLESLGPKSSVKWSPVLREKRTKKISRPRTTHPRIKYT
jgi:hypothetical protein